MTGPVYVYGIARAGLPVEGRGVLDGTVTTVESGPLAAIVSGVAKTDVRAKRRDLLLHSDVLQRAFADGPVVPLRFGTVFASVGELEQHLLEQRRPQLASLLDRFEGLGELRLRASYHDEEAVLTELVRGNPAIARLRGRSDQASLLQLGETVAAAYAARRDADAAAIVARLSEHGNETRVDAPTAELEVVRASFLVPKNDTKSFDEALESLALSLRHLIDFTCTGPMPPHSFVELEGA